MNLALMLLLTVTAFGAALIAVVSRKTQAEAKAVKRQVTAARQLSPAMRNLASSSAQTKVCMQRVRRHP